MEWLNLIVSNLPVIATIITLIVTLVRYVQKAIKEKNWGKLLKDIVKYMEEAEDKFDNGADRKEWVLAMVRISAETINYNINIDEVSKLIDDLCAMSKVVNAPSDENGKEVQVS